jgi:transposase
MIVIGADTHKQSHTVAAVSEATGRAVDDLTVQAKRRVFDDVLAWARRLDGERVWAIEDCRHVSGALERFLLVRGERVVRVAPKFVAGARNSARERGKSDRIDAVAIARAAIREGLDRLPIAQLAGAELDVRLLVDHRERLIRQRTALINDLRWQLHDLWPEFEIPARAPSGIRWQERVAGRLARAEQTTRVKIARDELRRIRELTRAIDALADELAALVAKLAPGLLAEPGCGVLTAAKLIGEIAGVSRFASDAKLARIASAAPIPASSGRTDRHRLDRGGNRQLNCALHRLAISKARLDPHTAAYLARKQAEGKSRRDAIRCLKRHLARRIWHILQTPSAPSDTRTPTPIMIHCNTPHGRFSLTYRDENPLGWAGAFRPVAFVASRVPERWARWENADRAGRVCSLGREPVDIAGRPCD